MNRLSRACFAAAFCLIAWAAHAFIFTPPMLFRTPSSGSGVSIVDLGGQGAGGGGAASVTVGSGGIPAGSTIVVLGNSSAGNFSGTAVTDTAGNTYVLKGSSSYSAGSLAAIWVVQNCSALVSGNTITVHVPVGQLSIAALALVGVPASSLDLTTTPTVGTSSTPSITSGTPTMAGEIFVAGLAYVAVSPTTTFTQAAGWSTPFDSITASGVVQNLAGGSRIQTGSAAPFTYAPSLSASNKWGLFLLTFKP